MPTPCAAWTRPWPAFRNLSPGIAQTGRRPAVPEDRFADHPRNHIKARKNRKTPKRPGRSAERFGLVLVWPGSPGLFLCVHVRSLLGTERIRFSSGKHLRRRKALFSRCLTEKSLRPAHRPLRRSKLISSMEEGMRTSIFSCRGSLRISLTRISPAFSPMPAEFCRI